MAYVVEGKAKQDLDWFSKLGAAVKHKVHGPGKEDQQWDDGGRVHPECIGNVPSEPRQWRGFAFAEAMEQGLAPGLSSMYLEPPPQGDNNQERRLVVQRSQNRASYSLATESGETLLLAKVSSDGLRFDLFTARNGEPQLSLGPVFALVASSGTRDNWCLSSIRCERCEARGKRQCGKRELARLSHYVESVGEGQAFCMDVDLPEAMQDGDRAVFCEQCGDASAQWALELSAKRPKWNPKHKSLTLDFFGRCSLASAKNFQLEDPREPGKTKFLFGKVAEHRFTLDYRPPLGTVQAFAAALSASHWK